MEIAAVVILYHPDETCVSNIKTYYDAVGKIYVFDNSEKVTVAGNAIRELSKVEYYRDSENRGLPVRLNQACTLAMAAGFQWILTMDQDSNFSPANMLKYLACFSKFDNKETVAMFGPAYEHQDVLPSAECRHTMENDIITSGSLLNLSLFNKIGSFDEALFIDCVDHDYSMRAVLAGFSIIRFSTVFLNHKLGNEVYRASVKTLFLVKKKKEIHSPLRCYYMFRNMLYLTKKFEAKNLSQIKTLKKDVLSRIQKAILYGRNTPEILLYVRKGYLDYKNNRMGRIDRK